MKTYHPILTLALSILAATPFLAAADDIESGNLECRKSATFLAPIDSPDYMKYAPDREVQILHLALDVTPDFKARTVAGTAVWKVKPLLNPVRELKLDAVDLNIHSVTATEKIQGWQATDKQLIVTFAEPVPVDKEVSLTITWDAAPLHGLYFRTPEMGYKEGDTHLFTQGEEIEAREWFPCFDSPNRKFTSEITSHLQPGMTSVSNGRLIFEEKDPATGMVTSHWSQEKPHSTYLISLVAGFLGKLEDKHRDIPLTFYTPPSEINVASNSFKNTKDIMAFFEEDIGVPYPWPKYAQVCVNDFVEGGMENTSCTTLTDSTLFVPDTESIRDSDGLISHEMAHQWFGDLVTCKDWGHVWLNEGFATYYETLYNGHKNGRDTMLYELWERIHSLINIPNDTTPIVRRNFDSSHDMFGYLSYPKASCVLHMLRSQLGDDLYRKCIKTYLQRHEYGSVVTEDLRRVIEEFTGQSYDQFFDQWLYHGHYPELEVSYSWDEQAKLARLSIQQVQKTSESVLLFRFPFKIRFKGASGSVDRTIEVKEKSEDFSFALDSAPTVVRLDPDYTLLARINFHPPSSMLEAQLKDQQDVIGRLLAIEPMVSRKDKATVEKLKKVLNEDPFFGCRMEAARALRGIHTDDSWDALQASQKQPDARVRQLVVEGITGFYSDAAYKSALSTLQTEKNPDILSPAIRSVAGYAKPEVDTTLIKYLNTESFRNELAGTAVGAMRTQDDPSLVQPLMDTLKKRASEFRSFGLANALDTVAYLARNQENKDAVREFLATYLDSEKRNVKLGAMRALGTLGDPRAIGALEKFSNAYKDSPERTTAARAVADLRAGRKPVDDFKNLRQEVLDLEKANRDLKKDLDDLKKKVESAAKATTNAPAPAKPAKKPTHTASQSPKSQ
jgi:aminopeptidase N